MMFKRFGVLMGAGALLLLARGWTEAAVAPAAAKSAVVRGQAKREHANKWFNPDPKLYLFENKLKPGMVGYGLTVMHGAQIQKFQVRILDVIKNFGPSMNVILVKCWGLGLRKSGIIEGMSGSPVYIDGKLIGAIAYGWGFSKEPIGGVQPIRQMLRIPVPKLGGGRQGAMGWSGGSGYVRGLGWNYAITHGWAGWGPLAAHLLVVQGGHAGPMRRGLGVFGRSGLVPLASPLMVSGASGTLLRYLRGEFRGTSLVAMAAGAAGRRGGRHATLLGGMRELKPGALRLRPGAAIGVPLLSGDADMGAIGTVTAVVGRRVYAFGHRFFAQGLTHLPISTAYIYTILPSVRTSFKIGSTDRVQGRLVMDQATGIVGELGRPIRQVPITVRMANASGTLDKTFHYKLYPNVNATVGSLGAAILASMVAHQKPKGLFTLHVAGRFNFNGAAIPFDDEITNSHYTTKGFMTRLLVPVGLLINNPFHKLVLTSANVHIFLDPVDRSAAITGVTVQRRVVAQGDTVVARVQLLNFNGTPRVVRLRLKVPVNIPNGQYHLVVGSARAVLQQAFDYYPQRFAPDNLATLIRAVRRILAYKDNRLYARLILNASGIAMGTREYPGLPASRSALIAQMNPAQTVPLYQDITAEVPAGAVVAQGGASFTIVVRHHADERFVGGAHLAPGAARLPMRPVPG